MLLRPYQQRCVDFLAPRERGFVIAPAGSGKTVIAAHAIAAVAKPGDRVGWIANTREQVEQGAAAIGQTEGAQGVEFDLFCAAAQPDVSECSILILDECFPAGTLVGSTPIEDLKAGDLIWGLDASGRPAAQAVLHVFKRALVGGLVRVVAGDFSVLCTPGHPFFTVNRGWVPAAGLTNRDVVHILSPHDNLLPLRNPRSLGERLEMDARSREARSAVLRAGMLKRLPGGGLLSDDGDDKPETRFSADAGAEPNEAASGPREDVPDLEGGGTLPENQGGQWTGTDRPAAPPVDAARARPVGHGAHSAHEGGGCRFTEPLQNRRGITGQDACGRNRRSLPRHSVGQTARRQERPRARLVGVDRVEVLQPTNPDGTAAGVAEVTVYNLSVSGLQNYFANGFLVHNCHHLPAETWLSTASAACGRVFGFSATPWNDSAPERDDVLRNFFGGTQNFVEIFQEEVRASGHLAEGAVVFLDLDRPGEFDASIEAKAEPEIKMRCRRFWNVPEFEHRRRVLWQFTQGAVQQNAARNAAAVLTTKQHAAAGQSVLILVASVEHGVELGAQIEGSLVVSSKMPGGVKARRAAIAAFKSGECKVLIATSLADEGLDVPIASVLVLVAGGRSSAKIIQRAGRVMRPFPGKTTGLVYDFTDRGAKFALAQARARKKVYQELGYTIETKTFHP